MSGLQLIATGGAIPGRTVTNEDLSRMVDTSDEWITSRTGIRTRHWCTEDESAATLAISAAKQALARSGLAPAQIGCCICATLSAPDATPSVACQVQAALGLPEDRPALDVNAACSGFLYGIAVARGLLTTLGGQYALVIGCEALSRLMDPADRSTCVLFGDGAGAAIFQLSDTPFALTLGARGSDVLHAGGPNRTGSAPITMDGKAVFRFAVDALPKCLHTVLDETQLTLDDLEWVVCHQANSRIIDHCVRALKADPAKFYKNMDRHGNTSAASIPVALNELAENGQLQPMTQQSGVFSWDDAIARWSFDKGQPAGAGTDTLPGVPYQILPLQSAARTWGLLLVEPENLRQLMIPEQQRLLETFTLLVASALERLTLTASEEQARLTSERESLRNSLLAALSHDLRTPLTVLFGQAEILTLDLASEGSKHAPQANEIRQHVLNTTRLVNNDGIPIRRNQRNGAPDFQR